MKKGGNKEDFNTLRPRQNELHWTRDIFNPFSWTTIAVFLFKFPNFPINNRPALVQTIVRRRKGGNSLSELTSLRFTNVSLGLYELTPWRRIRTRSIDNLPTLIYSEINCHYPGNWYSHTTITAYIKTNTLAATIMESPIHWMSRLPWGLIFFRNSGHLGIIQLRNNFDMSGFLNW